jgi:large subunit ribosomal protein L4
MPEIAVRDLTGAQVDTITVSDTVFAAPINGPLMHQAAIRLLADRRSGTQKAKTRGEVTGGGAKPWRQKGTGRGRQGSRTSPLWRGGGVVFAARPRSYAVRMPKKMRRQATRSALSSRVTDMRVLVVSSLEPDQPKTKSMLTALANLEATGKILLVDGRIAETTNRAARNLPDLHMKPASTLNLLDVLDHDYLIFSVDGIRQIERLLTDANA